MSRRCAALAIAFCLCAASSIAKPTYTTFTIPDAQDISVDGLNDGGTIVGTFDTAARSNNGFLRLPDGTITPFDPDGSQLTQPLSLDNNGDAVGYFNDGITYHGFLRTADGTITTIDPTGATRSEANSINDAGAITGSFEPGSHGYLRTPDGNFAIFDAPGADETQPEAIDGNNNVTGFFYSGGDYSKSHGFIRTADGNFTVFDVAGDPDGNTLPVGIADSGRVIGWYETHQAFAVGFDRSPSGKIETFTFPKSVAVVPTNMNASGSFVGIYFDRPLNDLKASPHAFFARSLKRMRTFNAPPCKHSYADNINAADVIAGACSDVPLGFIRTP